MKDFKVYQTSGCLTKLVTNASDVRDEYEEISGPLVQFYSPISAPLESLIVDIKPVQSGTGDPSPSNIRPFTGWTGCNIFRSGEDTSYPATFPISWQTEAGEVYGGTLTVNEDGSGSLIKKYSLVDGGNQSWQKVTSNYFRNFTFAWSRAEQHNTIATVWSSNYKGVASYSGATQEDDNYVWMRAAMGGDNQMCCVKDTSKASMSASAFKSAMSGVQFIALLKEEYWTTYTLTAQQITTLLGVNNIWADIGDVSVKYRTHY